MQIVCNQFAPLTYHQQTEILSVIKPEIISQYKYYYKHMDILSISHVLVQMCINSCYTMHFLTSHKNVEL